MNPARKTLIYTDPKRLPPADDSCKLFLAVVNSLKDAVFVFDETQTLILANSAAVHKFGLNTAAGRRRCLRILFGDKDPKSALKDSFKRLSKTASCETKRIQLKGPADKTHIMDLTLSHLACPRSQGFLLVQVEDQTEHITLQRRLDESLENYRQLCEEAGDPILTLNENGIITYANPIAGENMGLPVEAIIGHHFTEFIASSSLAKARQKFQQALKTGERFQETLDVVDVKGHIIPTELTVTPLAKNGRVHSLHVIARDISRRLEIDRIQRETEKLKTWQHFVSGASQELQSPLKVVAADMRRLHNRYARIPFEFLGYREYQRLLETLGRIADQIDYCADTVQRLLDMARNGKKAKQTIADPVAAARDVVNAHRSEFRHHKIRTRLVVPKRAIAVKISPVDLFQILNNLVNNAVQAMPAGGEVTIKIGVDRPLGRAVITVADTGVGIPREELGRVFEPFYTTKSRGSQRNSGLGLLICKTLVQRARGSIDIQSSLRKGTCVCIQLPLAAPKTVKNPPNNKPASSTRQQTSRIKS